MKFADPNLEKLCPQSLALASSTPVLGLDRICLKKSVLGWPRILFQSLASKVVSLTPSLVFIINQRSYGFTSQYGVTQVESPQNGGTRNGAVL